jgi:hypothetical protein
LSSAAERLTMLFSSSAVLDACGTVFSPHVNLWI